MTYVVTVNGVEVEIDLPGVGESAFGAVGELLHSELARPRVKARDVIKDAFLAALRTCPGANASDLWHHVVYRQYLEIYPTHRPSDADQSWKRTSGDALELSVEEIYRVVLAEHDVRIQMLIGSPKKLAALVSMGIHEVVGSDKLDVALYIDSTDRIFGGVHVKVSLAERVTDDVPCSTAMMSKGFFSPLWTMDVKSFPPPHSKPLVNRGELGTDEAPSQKRKYIVDHGSFDHLFSANARTSPSSSATPSGKRIIVIDPANQPDLFAKEVISRARILG